MDQIVIKIILASAVVLMMLHLFKRDNSQVRAYKKILLFVFSVSVVVAIFYPNTVTGVANMFGVGRGTDLIIYITSLIVIFKIIDDSLRRKTEKAKTAKIIRKIAILEKDIKK